MPPSRKNQIKKAITRKPKYGGPQGGRPNTSARVGRAKATSSGINYLVGARGHVANENRKFGSLTVSPKVKRQLGR